jgi:phage terminase large subunit GpA-like protein
MEALLSPGSLTREIEAFGRGDFLADPVELVEDALALFRLPERVSTLECAENHRLLPGAEAGAVVRYDRWRTPYNVGPMNSLDDPGCNLVVMVKPSRSGGTTVAENYLFKMMLFGPMGHAAWVLNSDEAVTDYCRNVVKPLFELNPDLQARVSRARGEDTDGFKRVSGYPVEWLSAKDSTFRNREPLFMVSDETDAYSKRYAATPKVQIDGRQKQLGNRRKAAIMSHPDLGWTSGVAACFEDSSRGIYAMQCPECLGYAAAYATKFWDKVPEFKLHWTRSEAASNDERLDLAERSAALTCPHCGVALSDEQRRTMVDAALRDNRNAQAGWMHRGQALDALEGIVGEMLPHQTHGFWVHGTMLKTVTLGKLARDYEAALIAFERTRNPSQLKEFLSKQLGEIFEGAATTGGVNARGLKARVREASFQRGIAPAPVCFITTAVDTGARKFDVIWIGWDLEGRSWILDRRTIRQRRHEDGEMRDLHLSGQVEDWTVLLPEVVERRFAIEGRSGWELPVAVTCVDVGDGNVTWKAREFARRALRQGYAWGKWSKIKLIKGFAGKKPLIPEAPRKVEKDEEGRPVEPVTLEYNLGADELKDLTYERLAVDDDGPGQVHFCAELEDRYIDEFFGETKLDGKWTRSGPNESLDLYGYAEAGRLLLKPDRKDIVWDDEARRPVWARPVRSEPEGGDPEAPVSGAPAPQPPRKTLFERIDALNKN